MLIVSLRQRRRGCAESVELEYRRRQVKIDTHQLPAAKSMSWAVESEVQAAGAGAPVDKTETLAHPEDGRKAVACVS